MKIVILKAILQVLQCVETLKIYLYKYKKYFGFCLGNANYIAVLWKFDIQDKTGILLKMTRKLNIYVQCKLRTKNYFVQKNFLILKYY